MDMKYSEYAILVLSTTTTQRLGCGAPMEQRRDLDDTS